MSGTKDREVYRTGALAANAFSPLPGAKLAVLSGHGSWHALRFDVPWMATGHAGARAYEVEMSDTIARSSDHSKPVRVRFAPSPTGYLHVGGARTALFNWLFAKKNDGTLVLRIEDTDKERSTQAAIDAIVDGLHWLGLDWDEGPYLQTDHLEAHRRAAQSLLERGLAYRDFSTKEELEAKREAAKGNFKRDEVMRELPEGESARRADAGDPFVVRFKVPQGRGLLQFDDLVLGPTKRHVQDLEDFALLRPDGSPTYHLSVVVDDSDMAITHVIRGRDHRDNTFKQILLLEALDRDVPVYAHVPLILAPDKAKLSKRKHGDVVALTTYRDAGFLPEAFRNFLALLGWSSGDDREFFSRDELIEAFELSGIGKTDAVYNFIPGHATKWLDQKAFWMNAQYLRRLDIEELLALVRPWLEEAGLWRDAYATDRHAWFRHAIDVLRERYFTLADFAQKGRPFFIDGTDLVFEAKATKNLDKTPGLRAALVELGGELRGLAEWTEEALEARVRAFGEAKGVDSGPLINGIRAAVTGQTVGPSLFVVLELLGRERSCARLEAA